jgi:hypothetical protein
MNIRRRGNCGFGCNRAATATGREGGRAGQKNSRFCDSARQTALLAFGFDLLLLLFGREFLGDFLFYCPIPACWRAKAKLYQELRRPWKARQQPRSHSLIVAIPSRFCWSALTNPQTKGALTRLRWSRHAPRLLSTCPVRPEILLNGLTLTDVSEGTPISVAEASQPTKLHYAAHRQTMFLSMLCEKLEAKGILSRDEFEDMLFDTVSGPGSAAAAAAAS